MRLTPFRLGVLASGKGTNFVRIVEATASGEIPNASVACLIVDRDAEALRHAERFQIPSYHIALSEFTAREAWSRAIAQTLQKHKVDLVLLAGFLRRLDAPVLAVYPKRILNIHPALLPKHGGQGMYGKHVHEHVLASGDPETGVTVHLVDAMYDHGTILAQEKIAVLATDTPESLEAKVHTLEYRIYPKAIANYLEKLR